MAEKNFDSINETRAEEKDQHETTGGIGSLLQMLSFLPCIPKYYELPEMPNIDQIKRILDRFKRHDPNETNVSVVERSNTYELCQWSEKVLSFLPSSSDSHDTGAVATVEHFSTLKKFYKAVQNAGVESCPELDLLFNTVQIYEAIMSIAFVVFQEHPDTLKLIDDELKSAVAKVEGHGTEGCLAVVCFAAALSSQFNRILANIDKLLGDMGVVGVAEFVAQIIEVFCRFFDIDMHDFQNFTAISQTIQDIINKISSALKSVFGDGVPKNQRTKKWSPLDLTERIKTKLSKFESRAPIVKRTLDSFGKLYKAIEKIDDDFEIQLNQVNQVRTVSGQDVDADTRRFDDADIELQPLCYAQRSANTEANHEEIKTIGKLFQNLETIISYGILAFSNENDLLEPLLDHVNESTRILENFFGLHPLYKLLCGRNYLSKLKAIFKKIVQLLENSKLKFNTPKEFLKEFNKNYPNLLYLICESLLNDKLKTKLDKLPEPMQNFLDDALDSSFSKFKNKFLNS